VGYSVDYFGVHVNAWLEAGWLKPGSKLVDFGGQEFYCDQDDARRHADQFLRQRGVSEDRIKTAIGGNGRVSVAAIHRALDVDYFSIDVDNKYGTTFFDLNTFAPPMEWRGTFDFVNNEGTIEHLVNPVNGFQVAHELLKVGGVARHSIPLTGHRDHGLIYPTVKFYGCMLGENQYELLRSDIYVGQSDLDFADRRFRTLMDDGKAPPDTMKLTDAWLFVVYRKTQPAEFRIPFDHLAVDLPEALGERLSGSYSAYSRMRLTASGKRDPIGDEFERQVELQRREQDLKLQSIRRNPFALSATVFAIGLNGVGLLISEGPPSAPNRVAFVVGVALAFLSAVVATFRQQGMRGSLARHGMRLLWLAAAAAFIAGCLTR
jgi:SAM-dependent methyltransferase